jgi:hypothetical protein
MFRERPMPASESARRHLDWWPQFVREIFVAIGAALSCDP